MDWQQLLNKQRLGTNSGLHLDARSEFQRDFDRIVFSPAFRRLQSKTQVFPLPETDFIHTRLTHSLEAACVGRSLGKIAGKGIIAAAPDLFKTHDIQSDDIGAVVSAAALAHDIGNPPFGHSGEDAIAEFFTNAQGARYLQGMTDAEKYDLQHYEGNAAGFRLLTYTLPHVSSLGGGLRLTYATLGAFSKYPCSSHRTVNSEKRASTKKYGFFQSETDIFKEVAERLKLIPNPAFSGHGWFRHPLSFLVEAADDICYKIMDLEDGYKLKLLPYSQIEDLLCRLIKDINTNKVKSIFDERERLSYLRAVAINCLVKQSADVFIEHLDGIQEGSFDTPLLDLVPGREVIQFIDEISKKEIYGYRKVIEIESAGFEVISGLLDAFLCAVFQPDSLRYRKIAQLIPSQYFTPLVVKDDNRYDVIMNLVQFVAGMTDTFALSTYRTIKGISLPTY
ncbi:dNTP triphosphohydrolase [bacterium]|nr:dNTP triphosphohydrolase [bacterium]